MSDARNGDFWHELIDAAEAQRDAARAECDALRAELAILKRRALATSPRPSPLYAVFVHGYELDYYASDSPSTDRDVSHARKFRSVPEADLWVESQPWLKGQNVQIVGLVRGQE